MEADQNTQQQLEQVRRNIEQWRQTRTKLGAMPAALWDEAAAVARAGGTHRVSRALGLNYLVLRQRAFPKTRAGAKQLPRSNRRASKRPTFVEVNPPAAVVPSDAIVVEVVAASGARLMLRLNGGGVSPEFAALIASFR